MAKKRKKRRKTGKMPPGLRRYWQGKNKRRASGGTKAMAKKRKRRSGGGPRRRRGGSRRRRAGGGGIVGAITGDMELMVAGGVYGFAERKAKTEADFILNKVPKPIDALGFAGNTALMLYLAAYLTKNKYLKVGARATATIATYQLGRKGEAFKSGTEHFTVAGAGDEMLLGDDEMDDIGDDDIGDDDIGDDDGLDSE